MNKMSKSTFSVAQIVGDRSHQEDYFACETLELMTGSRNKVANIFVVADGMGGHASGEIASRTAVGSFVRSVRKESPWSDERLTIALEEANYDISEAVNRDSSLRGMGTTFLAALCTGKRLAWISVGDSLLLLFRGSQLQRLNEDHSMLPHLIQSAEARGQNREVALMDPRRHRLRSALTGRSPEIVDSSDFELRPNDLLILASDGIETISMNELRSLLDRSAGKPPEVLSKLIIDEILEREALEQDNATLIIYRHD